ncbi:MAG: DoxX family protein [Gemmatimonadales bacterium]
MSARFATQRQTEIGLGILRIVTGLVFAAHGYQKFFTMHIEGVTGFFTGLGVPLPGISAILVSTLELAGGLAFAAGLFTRPIGVLLALDMAGAIFFFHTGFFVPKGVEFVLMNLASALALAIGGPGAFAIDRMIGGRGSASRT